MKDLSIFFSPINLNNEDYLNGIGNKVIAHTENNFPELKNGSVAIFHVPEFRTDNHFKSRPNVLTEHFRNAFYHLKKGYNWQFEIYDLGTILPGTEVNDTRFALTTVVEELVKNQILPIIVGGGQDLTFSMFKAYESLEQMVNICSVDHQLDLGNPETEMHAEGYLSHLLMQRPCYLFNHTNIGLQIPYATLEEFELFEKLYFDVCRLGEFNADFTKAEPHLRNADILSIDLNSIKSSETLNASNMPNGFYAEQMCQIAKYAGISDKLTSLGVFSYYPEETSGVYSSLVAHILWYFMDGLANRKNDYPTGSKKNYAKFYVQLENQAQPLVFYKSDKSHRWWMEVSYPGAKDSKYERHYLVPCNKDDYDKAQENELPDLWWKTYQKLV